MIASSSPNRKHNTQRALHYIHLAHELALQSGSKKQLAENHKQTGDFYYKKDALDAALHYYLKARSYYENKKESSDQLTIENTLAIIYARTKDPDKALE